MTKSPFLSALAIIIAALLTVAPGFGDDKPRRTERYGDIEIDQDQALALLKSKDFRPLDEILAAAVKVIPGRVIRIKAKRVNGRIAYELKIVSQSGALREIYIDPRNLDILKVE
ncbi:MAG TPA: hypothetical protein PK264_10485 [Hyphomicrobiaceae bacterium]|nr:hypothetical protein [Hyphomicrobiaceae bacterium]